MYRFLRGPVGLMDFVIGGRVFVRVIQFNDVICGYVEKDNSIRVDVVCADGIFADQVW